MCGRYSLSLGRDELEEELSERLGCEVEVDDEHEPRYNAAPSQELPVVTSEKPDEAEHLRWGLVPRWSDDPSNTYINARAETVDAKPAFSEAYSSRRCLVPADGFYEWRKEGDGKKPYRFVFDGLGLMAGIYEERVPETKQTSLEGFDETETDDTEVVRSFVVVTTEANETVDGYHDRMSVVVPEGEEETWLHGDAEEAGSLMVPSSDEPTDVYRVSDAVNDPSNDSPEVAEPLDTRHNS
ncbi:MAG: SOS response-associated peptidase [Halobacteria archaeon]|nr:SOS response-associated peptidase [Halobacteria archaeon]